MPKTAFLSSSYVELRLKKVIIIIMDGCTGAGGGGGGGIVRGWGWGWGWGAAGGWMWLVGGGGDGSFEITHESSSSIAQTIVA